MRVKPIGLVEDQTVEGIPCHKLIDESMRLPGQTVQAIPEDPVEPFEVNGVGLLDGLSDRLADLDPDPSPSLAVFHRLSEADSCGLHNLTSTDFLSQQ